MPAVAKVEIPDEIWKNENYKNIVEAEEEIYQDYILMLRHQGKISLGKAAELLGISYSECYNLLVKKGLPIANVSQEEREESYKRFEEKLEKFGL